MRYPGRVAGGSRQQETLAWERQPTETLHAFARFVEYRQMPLPERSLGKLSISRKRACELSARHKWVRRAAAYDDWCATLAATVDKQAHLSHRARAARLASTLLDKANESATKLDASKVSAGEIALLGKAGVQVAESAFGPLNDTQIAQPVNVNVGVNFASPVRPAWLENAEHSQRQAEVIEVKPNKINQKVNKVLVYDDEKVLAKGGAAPPRTGHGKVKGMLPPPQQETIQRKGLREQVIEAPRRHED